jgi:hypothetical protein
MPEMHAGIEEVFNGDVHDDRCIFRHTGRPEGRLAIELDVWICRPRLSPPDGGDRPGDGKGLKTPERAAHGKLEVGAGRTRNR